MKDFQSDIKRKETDWTTKANNVKLLDAIAEFNSNTQKVSLVHNGVLTGDRPKQPTVISCQFSTIPREGGSKKKQFKLGLGDCGWSHAGLELAKQRATKISLKLQHNEFDWEWFDEFIKGHKPIDEKAIALNTPVQVWIDKLYATKRGEMKPTSFRINYDRFFDLFPGKIAQRSQESPHAFNARKAQLVKEFRQKPLIESMIINCLEATEANTSSRSRCYSALKSLVEIAGLSNYFSRIFTVYKSSTSFKNKFKIIPSDLRIKNAYYHEIAPAISDERIKYENDCRWQWLYGLLATYGLRVHEAWKIANWDKAVYLKDNDWVEINETDDITRLSANTIIPAFNSPENDMHVLAIGNQTKTGYRLAYPLSPAGEDWVKEFNLKGQMRLPKILSPTSKEKWRSPMEIKSSNYVSMKFKRRGLEFTPHALRHAYSHRGRVLGIPSNILALSLGHSESENITTYAKHMAIETKREALDNIFKKMIIKSSESLLK